MLQKLELIESYSTIRTIGGSRFLFEFLLLPTLIINICGTLPTFQYNCLDTQEANCSNIETSNGCLYNDINSKPYEILAFDVKPFVRAIQRDSKLEYQLTAGISWQITYLKESVESLEIKNEENNRWCFYFNMSNAQWSDTATNPSLRFYFTSENIFNFGESYRLKLTKLSKTREALYSILKRVDMPNRPDFQSIDEKIDCNKAVNRNASQWVAAFRKVLVLPLIRAIQIEFVGAPPQYCFEAYEVRLKDENAFDLVRSALIPVSKMRKEIIQNRTILFGEFTFSNLPDDKYYIPSILPVDRLSDGRCACPVLTEDFSGKQAICSCIAADWKKIRINRIITSMSTNQSPVDKQSNLTAIEKISSFADRYWLITTFILSVLLLALLIVLHQLCCSSFNRITFLKRHLNKQQPGSDRSINTHNEIIHLRTPLLDGSTRLRVLIIYSHDCTEHEEVVATFAELLREHFDLDVKIDIWSTEKIEANLMDYISISFMNADKVIIVNSIGAYFRYKSKIEQTYRLERECRSIFDDLFELQIDHAISHNRLISVRFNYTSATFIIPPLTYALQYVLPENIHFALMNICSSKFVKVQSAVSLTLQSTISRMLTLIESNPDWFQKTHYKVKISNESPIHQEYLSKTYGNTEIYDNHVSQKIKMPSKESELSMEDYGLLCTTSKESSHMELGPILDEIPGFKSSFEIIPSNVKPDIIQELSICGKNQVSIEERKKSQISDSCDDSGLIEDICIGNIDN